MADKLKGYIKVKNDLDNLFKLDGKIIVVTGAAGLLGQMHAEAIAAYGGTPVLLDLNKEDLDRQSKKLNKTYSVNSVGFEVDITNESEIRLNVEKLVKRFGKIDGLVNNAANNPTLENKQDSNFSRLENFPLNLWSQDIAVGLTGSFLCSKYYGWQISQNPNGGSIVNISSDLGLIAPDQRLYFQNKLSESQQQVKPVTYSVVKTGIIGLTRYLSTYWANENVRCNAICPGGVDNNQPENFIRDVSFRIPMNRLAEASEYQGTLVWMLSDASSYLTGAIVPVDGGRTAW
jgi:NAD(P)-dependent dehydrogenase (short-subunit alcohol dehydrogenase family)